MLTRTGLAICAGAAIVGALGVRFGYVELIAAAVCALGLLVVGWISAHRDTGLVPVRDALPRRAARGETVPSRIRVRNAGRGPLPSMVVIDELDGKTVEAVLQPLGTGGEVTLDADLPAARRGVRTVGPIRIRRTDPFGLFAVERTYDLAHELLIHPRVHPLSGTRGIGRFAEVELARRRADADPLAGFQSMREYVPGDDTRSIHWATTAKAGRLMVREYVDPRRPTYTLVLLTNAGDYQGDDFEEAVDVVASLASHVLSHEMDVVLRTTDPQHAGPSTPIRDEREALDLLARVETTSDLTTVPIARLLVSARQRSTVIAVGGPLGSGLGDLRGAHGDIGSVRIGSPAGPSTPRVLSALDAGTFAVQWNESAI